ncbi:Uncharacterised protein [Salmonella enterica subsp. enterica]|nr:Uncharacterised protein [Salmonella enterica subsp. enterica]
MYLSEHTDVLTEQPEYSHSDLKLLELLNQLEPDVRKDLLRSAAENSEWPPWRKKVEELSLQLAEVKRSA